MPKKRNELNEADRRLFTEIAAGMSYDTRIFDQRFRQEINRLTRSGLDEQSIIRVLEQDFTTNGRIFGEFRNAIKRAVVLGVMQGFRVGQDNIYGDSLKFKWVSVGSPSICKDCEERVGQV